MSTSLQSAGSVRNLSSLDNSLTESLLRASATRAERMYSLGRAVFCIAMIARYLAIHGLALVVVSPECWFAVTVLCVPLTFSGFVIYQSAQAPLTTGVFYASVLVDAVACTTSLATEAIWPTPAYLGILNGPDIAIVTLLVFTTSLRLFPGVIFAGVCANLGLTVVLVALDNYLNSTQVMGWIQASIELLYILGAGAIAYITVTRTYDLVYTAAEKARDAERTQQSMTYLLREQHDTRSLLSALELTAERLASSAGDDGSDLVSALRTNLRELHQSIVSARDRAYLELTSLDTLQPADVQDALLSAVRRVQQRRNGLDVNIGPIQGATIFVRGGQSTLEHILLNLLINAVEGDGRRGAKAAFIRVRLCENEPGLCLTIEDDGPGFPAFVTSGQGESPAPSAKPESSGLGLWLVRRVVLRSGGDVRYENRPNGGASVTLRLLTKPA